MSLIITAQAFGSCDYQKSFDDQDLKLLFKNSKKVGTSGIIYIWSPHMVLSFMGIQEVRALAQSLNIELTVLLDPFADQIAIEKVITNEEVTLLPLDCRRQKSDQLFELGISVHYPTYLFYQNGKVLPPRFPGYEDAKELKKIIKEKLKL